MNSFNYIGKNISRADGPDKLRGSYTYLIDDLPARLLHGIILFSERPHALVKHLDISEALKIEGVNIFTYDDTPKNLYNSGEWFPGQKDHCDENLLTNHVRHVGDRIALIIAPSREIALAARDLIKVDYEDLPPLIDFEKALANASLLHDDQVKSFPGGFSYGDTNEAFQNAAFVETDTIITPKIHHAALEPHAVMAVMKPENILEVHTPCQIMFGVQHSISQVLDLPFSKIRVIKTRMGGTFGGKQEVVFEPLCAWAAWKLKTAVLIETNREESILATRTRAASQGTIKTALDKDGNILAREFDISLDAGAYITGTKKVLMAMAKKTPRLYKIPALKYSGQVIRTTTTPAGACRGYGSPQIHAITEIHTDLMCRRLGLDPVAFRLKNLVEPYGKDPSDGPDLGNARIIDCLTKGLEAFQWDKYKNPSVSGRWKRGAGFATSTHGNGYYKTIYHDFAGMRLRIMEDGSAVIQAGVHELGNAAADAVTQIVAETTSISPDQITVLEGDTLINHYDIGCQASRGIFVLGECARLCAKKAIDLLLSETEKLFKEKTKLHKSALWIGNEIMPIGEAVRQLEMKNRISIDVSVEYRPEINPSSYGAHFVDLSVDTCTGLVKINKYLAVHDIGFAINPSFVKGQIYGGVQMGLGMALTEELAYNEKGYPLARNFDKYHIYNAPDMPDVEVLLIEEGEPGGPYGAKSIGEIATVPIAPAVANAINRALDLELTQLPMTPARIINALNNN